VTSFFGNPLMLLALLAAALPWIIEWLFRRRKRQVDLPTLRFLLRNKDQENIKRQDRILLLVRTLLLLLLALALARPQVRHGMMGDGRRRHLVIALDATASMHQQVGVTTAFGVAQRRASGLIRGVEGDALITVLSFGTRAEGVLEKETDAHTAAAKVDALRATLGAVPAASALQWMSEYFKRAEDETAAEVYVFSDFQRNTWSPPGGLAAETSRLLGELGEKNDLYLVDVGSKHDFNYVLSELRPTEFALSTKLPVTFQVQVGTWGRPPRDARPSVTLVVDGDSKDVRYFEPGEKPAVVSFDHTFAQPGEYVVEAVVEGDQHLIDNQRAYLCTVPETFPVLILDETAPVTGAAAPETQAETAVDPLRMESVFLTRAIAPPTHPAMEKVTRFSATSIHPSMLRYENLDRYPVMIATQLAHVDESLGARLKQYAAAGGSLWFFLGPNINAFDYNRHFYAEGQGPLPGALLDVKTITADAADSDARPYLNFGASTHPALHALGASVARDARFSVLYNLNLQEGARVALAMSDGTPFLIEKEYGRGRVLLANATAGAHWTYLPAVIEYPVLVQDTLRYLMGNPDEKVNVDAGDPFEQLVFVSAQHLILQAPDGQRSRLTPQARPDQEDAWFVRYEDTDQQGVYRFVDTLPGVVPRTRFVVNPRSEQGDLSRLSESGFRNAFGRGQYTWVNPEVPIEDLAAKMHAVTEFSQFFLWIVLIVLGVEAFLALRFGRRRARGMKTA
jgi:hypothetical protein